ncbi:MAG: ATP phosphoribosyltransferase regulatory subunit, partial [Parcubacteria group bacterium]
KLVLRTEFTQPFARFIASNQQLKMPFKRYQIGEVFRDGPLKLGRYREFWQCDVDVVGVKDSSVEKELLTLVNEAFAKIGLSIEIKVNNRKILNAILNVAGVEKDLQESAIIAIDKLDKIGEEGVAKELTGRGLNDSQIKKINSLLNLSGDNEVLIKKSQKELGDNDGFAEVEALITVPNVVFTPSLARGLAYYTGNVFEVYLKDKSKLNSALGAGGRYDDMIGGFMGSGQVIPAVGFSFGLETIADALTLTANDKELVNSVVKIYVATVGDYQKEATELCSKLREAGIAVDMDFQGRKLKNNLEYANSYGIPWVAILGEDEVRGGVATIKNMKTGEQTKADVDKIVEMVRQ